MVAGGWWLVAAYPTYPLARFPANLRAVHNHSRSGTRKLSQAKHHVTAVEHAHASSRKMLVSLTVGKVDAGVAVLLTEDKRLVSLPKPLSAQRSAGASL